MFPPSDISAYGNLCFLQRLSMILNWPSCQISTLLTRPYLSSKSRWHPTNRDPAVSVHEGTRGWNVPSCGFPSTSPRPWSPHLKPVTMGPPLTTVALDGSSYCDGEESAATLTTATASATASAVVAALPERNRKRGQTRSVKGGA